MGLKWAKSKTIHGGDEHFSCLIRKEIALRYGRFEPEEYRAGSITISESAEKLFTDNDIAKLHCLPRKNCKRRFMTFSYTGKDVPIECLSNLI